MKDEQLYLEQILERIEMIAEFTVEGRDEFLKSLKTQEAVIRCFEVIGEIIKRLSPDKLADYPHIPWKQITGFRDFLIHHYDEIKIEVVWQVVEDDLIPLKTAIQGMLSDTEE